MTVDFATRTEVEVVADAVMAMSRGRFFPTASLPDIAACVGVSLHDLRDADIRYERHHYTPPKARPVIPGGVPTSPLPSPDRPPTRMTVPEPANDEDSPASFKWCSSCSHHKLDDAFSGYATCDECRERDNRRSRERREQREKAQRRLMVGVAERVSVRVSPDGLGLDLVCARCGKPFEPGQVVCGELYHKGCAPILA